MQMIPDSSSVALQVMTYEYGTYPLPLRLGWS